MTLTQSNPHLMPTTEDSFDNLGLSPAILKCIKNVGFVHPTPIQKAIIPTAIQGQDLIGLAQTGSGKTAAFALPIAERLTHGRGLRCIILCPTREIALQTKEFLDLFGKDHHLITACFIGGVRLQSQMPDLRKNPDIIVATPGRLFDLMERKLINVNLVQELVLDEADHMLDMGFLPQIRQILSRLPKKRHTMMFSATMPGPIESLAQQFLQDPIRIDLLPETRAATGLTHQLYLVEPADKDACLKALVESSPEDVVLVFTRRKIEADWLTRYLTRFDIPVEVIHSNRSQQERTLALKGFRQGKHRILIATDIAARGIDVPGIHHIINYDIPENVEDYIHRAGRTARAGAVGTVSTIATGIERARIKDIEQAIGQELPRCTVQGVAPYVEFKIKDDQSARRRKKW